MSQNYYPSSFILSMRPGLVLLLIIASMTLSAQMTRPFATRYTANHSGRTNIQKRFKDTISNAEKATWSERDRCYVMIEGNLVKCRTWYSKSGEIVKTVRYYKEDGLSPFVLFIINNKYAGKAIFGVTETHNNEGVNYSIILEDDRKWYHVNSDNLGNSYIHKQYSKS